MPNDLTVALFLLAGTAVQFLLAVVDLGSENSDVIGLPRAERRALDPRARRRRRRVLWAAGGWTLLGCAALFNLMNVLS